MSGGGGAPKLSTQAVRFTFPGAGLDRLVAPTARRGAIDAPKLRATRPVRHRRRGQPRCGTARLARHSRASIAPCPALIAGRAGGERRRRKGRGGAPPREGRGGGTLLDGAGAAGASLQARGRRPARRRSLALRRRDPRDSRAPEASGERLGTLASGPTLERSLDRSDQAPRRGASGEGSEDLEQSTAGKSQRRAQPELRS
jgi:hypothetical protein